jgi:hypothetical protein
MPLRACRPRLTASQGGVKITGNGKDEGKGKGNNSKAKSKSKCSAIA